MLFQKALISKLVKTPKYNPQAMLIGPTAIVVIINANIIFLFNFSFIMFNFLIFLLNKFMSTLSVTLTAPKEFVITQEEKHIVDPEEISNIVIERIIDIPSTRKVLVELSEFGEVELPSLSDENYITNWTNSEILSAVHAYINS